MCRCGGGVWGSRIRSVSRPRCSPASASRRLADARALVTEMPATLHALAAGRVSRAGCAGGDHGDAVSDPGGPWPGGRRARSGGGVDVGARRSRQAVRRRVIELDQDAAVRRAARAREDRYVSIRPLPDTMAKITAVLPVEQAVACFASLRAAARISEGERGRTDQGADQGRHPHRTDHRPDHRGCCPGGGPAGDDQRRPAGTQRGTRPTPRPWSGAGVPGPTDHHPRPRRHRSPGVGAAVAHRPDRRHRGHHGHQTAPVRRRAGGVDQRPRPGLPRPLLLSARSATSTTSTTTRAVVPPRQPTTASDSVNAATWSTRSPAGTPPAPPNTGS